VPTSQIGPSTSGPISNLFDALVKAGVVSATPSITVSGDTSKQEGDAQPIDLERESSRTYRKSILSQVIKLTSTDITKYVVFTRPV
jgi:pre-mRNA cleavage complex 2 protein Pcf11